MTKGQIKYMVDRFLSWKLPQNFNPDAGISFKPGHEPCGTNLFDATQVDAMVRHMIERMPSDNEVDEVDEILAGLDRQIGKLLSEPCSPVEDKIINVLGVLLEIMRYERPSATGRDK